MPVLSEQMTEAEPSVSTDDSFLTMALRFAMRCTPSASTTRQDRRQALGHRRDRQRHAEQQHRDDVGSGADVGEQQHGRHDHDGDDDDRDAEHATDAAHFLLQRRRLLPVAVEHFGDRTHLGLHAGRGDHRAAGALRDGRALEDHVEPVAERSRLRQRRGVLAARLRSRRSARLPARAATRPAPGARRHRRRRLRRARARRRAPARRWGRAATCPSRTTAEVTAVIRASAATAFSRLGLLHVARALR